MEIPDCTAETLPLWQLDIVELTGHNLEARGREDVNRLLQQGWHLLHIYTLKYNEDGVWRERPMAILGRSRAKQKHGTAESIRSRVDAGSETDVQKRVLAEAGALFAV